jgi:hypothetical protein
MTLGTLTYEFSLFRSELTAEYIPMNLGDETGQLREFPIMRL